MDLLIENKETIKSIQDALDKVIGETFCPYRGCLLRFMEHHHIDEYTITFRKPEDKNNSISNKFVFAIPVEGSENAV